eukprot:jgi/Chrzof1/2609/Cz11g22100.t1
MTDLQVHVQQPGYHQTRPKTGFVNSIDNVRIYYEVHGLDADMSPLDSKPRVVMVMGLACSCSAWRWQLQDLMTHHLQAVAHGDGKLASLQSPFQVCIIDNRGVGNSSSPAKKREYSTASMAQDVLQVMNHLGWSKAHVVGFSMGGMIATKLAVLSPSRVLSLTLISTSAGGWQIVPHTFKGLRRALKMVTAKSPEEQADATLNMHFSVKTLRQWVSHHAAMRRELLRREYMTPSGPPQPEHGFKGQLHACWHHSVTNDDVGVIRSANFPICVIHGRHDMLASHQNAEILAERLGAPCIILDGAHFIVRECAGQINMILTSLILGQQHIQAVPSSPYLDPPANLQHKWEEEVCMSLAAAGAAAAAVHPR